MCINYKVGNSHFAREKPGRHHINYMIKVNINYMIKVNIATNKTH